jgi:hypothetical protein
MGSGISGDCYRTVVQIQFKLLGGERGRERESYLEVFE